MLTSRHPFSAPSRTRLFKEIVYARAAKIPGVHAVTQSLLDGLLRKDPKARLQLPMILVECEMFTGRGKQLPL
jgi:hypothetical protein